MLSAPHNSRQWLFDVVNSRRLSFPLPVPNRNNKRFRVVQHKLFQSSCYSLHRLRCQRTYCPDPVFLFDFLGRIKNGRTWKRKVKLRVCSHIRFQQPSLDLVTVCRCVCRLWPDYRLSITPRDHEESFSHGRCSIISRNQLPELYLIA